jgi:hypothetical protein
MGEIGIAAVTGGTLDMYSAKVLYFLRMIIAIGCTTYKGAFAVNVQHNKRLTHVTPPQEFGSSLRRLLRG